MTDLVIEVRGGVVVEAYASDSDVRVTLIDWDAIHAGEAHAGLVCPTVALDEMPSDTASAYSAAILDAPDGRR